MDLSEISFKPILLIKKIFSVESIGMLVWLYIIGDRTPAGAEGTGKLRTWYCVRGVIADGVPEERGLS